MDASAMKDIKTFSKSLCDETIEGYNQILKTNSNFKLKDSKSKVVFKNLYKILKNLEEKEDLNDVYIQINPTYIPKRLAENIRQFRFLYIDFDDQEDNECLCFYQVWELANEGIIPEPTMAVASGQGVHVYWKIENAPKGAYHTWQALEDYLYNKLKHLGADKKATDSVRLLRIPGTNNSENDKVCRILYSSKKQYSMYDLREKYLKIGTENKTLKKNKTVNNKFFNTYSLHMSRIEDLYTLLKLRDFDIKGFRNSFIHLFAYWQGIYTRDLKELKSQVLEFNKSFKEPLKLSEIGSIVRSVDRAVNRFLEYQGSLYSGEKKRISKAMREKGGYWYKNETIIEMLGIDKKEQVNLKTIISEDEKYRRKNNKRYPKNEEGLTKKQAELKELFIKAKALKDKGLSQREIAKKLNVSKDKIYRIFKNNEE